MKTKLGIAVIGTGFLVAQGCATEIGEAEGENVSSAQSAVTANAVYTLKGVHSQKCMDVNGGSTANGANIQIYDCHGGTPQQFKFEDMGSGFYRLRNVASNKCVDVYNFSTADGGNINQWDCSSNHNQQFSVNDAGNGRKYLVGRQSGKALDVAGWGTTNGSNVHQWSYGGGDNQKWILTEVGGSTSTSTSSSSIPNECINDGRIEMTCAALAVAIADEIGEMNPLRDLAVSGDRVVLSSEGRNRCNARGGCSNIDAVLSMQDSSVNSVLPESVFSATAFRTNLVAQWYEQNNYEIDLNTNNPHLLPGPHSLTRTGTAKAYCGTDFIFNVSWNCSGGSGAYQMSGNQVSMEAENADRNVASANTGDKFQNSGGVMQALSDSGDYWTSNIQANAPRLEFDVEFDGSGTFYAHVLAAGPNGGGDSVHIALDGVIVHNRLDVNSANSLSWANSVGFNVSSSGLHTITVFAREDGVRVDKVVVNKNAGSPSWSGESASGSGGSCTTDASTIENRMKFFRPSNTVIDFRAENDTVTIDPSGTMNGGGDSGSGSCLDACNYYDRQASNMVGDCCTCDGQQGIFEASQGSPRVVLCNTQ